MTILKTDLDSMFKEAEERIQRISDKLTLNHCVLDTATDDTDNYDHFTL